MSMKRTDLEKHLAKKIDGRMKSGTVPQRFGQGSAAAITKIDPKSRDAVARLVPVACRLPAELVNRLRKQSVGIEGGMNAVMAQAVELWLKSAAGASTADEA